MNSMPRKRMGEGDLLAKIMGHLIGNAANGLSLDLPSPQEVEISQGDGRSIVLTFELQSQKRGKFSSKFWVATAARYGTRTAGEGSASTLVSKPDLPRGRRN